MVHHNGPIASNQPLGVGSTGHDTDPITFFEHDYSRARAEFRRLAEVAGGRLRSIPVEGSGPTGEDLSIDLADFGPASARRVLIHVSGTHGVEGFTGSSIQRNLLGQLNLPPDVGLRIVHAVNPWGMAWLRRPNERNVDLNRSFLPPGSPTPETPEAYRRLAPLIDPGQPPNRDLFLLRLLPWIPRYGLAKMFQATAGGQYEFPRGLFYGGNGPEPETRALTQSIGEVACAAERAALIDIHTGLGRFGRDMIMVDPEPTGLTLPLARQVFRDRVVTFAGGGASYRASGSLPAALHWIAPGVSAVTMTQEFGTYPPPWVLKTLRTENLHHQYERPDIHSDPKRWNRHMFNPPALKWRRMVLEQGRRRFQQALAWLSER